MEPAEVSLVALAVTNAISSFHGFLPPLQEVRRTHMNDSEMVTDIRVGEAAAVGLTVGVGAILASISGKTQPLVMSIVAGAALIAMYECTLRRT